MIFQLDTLDSLAVNVATTGIQKLREVITTRVGNASARTVLMDLTTQIDKETNNARGVIDSVKGKLPNRSLDAVATNAKEAEFYR